jgi:hypothetical protein
VRWARDARYGASAAILSIEKGFRYRFPSTNGMKNT